MKNSTRNQKLSIHLACLLPIIVFCSQCNDSDIVEIPDNFFYYTLIDLGIDADGDGEISGSEAEAVHILDMSSYGCLRDLTGIEMFINLDTLICTNSKIDTIDLWNNTELVYLDCSENEISYLDVNQCGKLKTLKCQGNNNLESLDLSGCILLDSLVCIDNNINSLDLSSNQALSFVECARNPIEVLNVRNCSNLQWLDCRQNDLSLIDLSDLSSLEYLDCCFNYLTVLDVSENSELKNLDCGCHTNSISVLDVSNNPKLEFLNCMAIDLEELILNGAEGLKYLYASSNLLTTLDLSENLVLEYAYLSGNPDLNCICVWEMPFPPENIFVSISGCPDAYFSLDCS